MPTLRQLTAALGFSLVLAPAAWAQGTATPPPPTTTSPATTPAQEDVYTLTPFEVSGEKDAGYYAENTLAGSRLNTNIGDLAASISVVTKQQMEDTGSLDINDVFRYEASTEGSSTYTPVVIDRGSIKDTISGYTLGNTGGTTTNAQSNRVRGLSAPDAAMDNYNTNSRIPWDSYNTQSVEINRGPNSMLFGMGSPAGIVNQSTLRAVLDQQQYSVSLRTDDQGSFRTSVSFNQPLAEGKLAIAGALLYNDQKFERRPSYDLTRRQYGTFTWKPFKNTVLRAFAENYENRANRPNFTTPRDYVTPWINAGRPAYDPIAGTITIQDSGQVLGPYYFNTRSGRRNPAIPATLVGGTLLTNSASPYYIPEGIGFDTGGSPLQRLDSGATIDYFQRFAGFYATAFTNPATAVFNPNGTTPWAVGDPRWDILDRQWTFSTAALAPRNPDGSNIYSSYNQPAISDKSIYDYTRYNTNEPNFGQTDAQNYNIEFEQKITDNLFLSAGWFRQQIDASQNYILNQLQGNALQIDTNTRLLDGTVNPYFGLPLIQLGVGNGVDTFFQPERDDNYRVMVNYNLDFTKNDGWLKWLGKHRFLGLWADQTQRQTNERWRLGYRGNGSDPEGALRYTRNLSLSGQANWSLTNIKKAYYMASPGDPEATVTHSTGFYGNPGWAGPYTARITAYNFSATTADPNNTANDGFHSFNVTEQISFSDAGSFKAFRDVESWNIADQAYLWNDRIIGTVGWREDDYTARQTTTGIIRNPDGSIREGALTTAQLYANGFSGDINYPLVMNRWGAEDHLTGNTKSLGVAVRPMRDWATVSGDSVVAQLARGLTLYYNKSDNFNAPGVAQTDYFGKALPKPTGEGEDYGFGISLFDNKLVARINWFTTSNHAERTSVAGTLLTRLIYSDTTTGIPWASTVLRIKNAEATGLTLAQITSVNGWNTDAVNPVNDEANQRKIWDMLGLPYQYYSGITIGGTQESKSKGTEIQLTYNPSRNWTMKLTGSKTEALYTAIAPQYDEWLAERLPVWESLKSDIPDFVDVSSGTGSRQYRLSTFWEGYGFAGVALAENTNGVNTPHEYFDSVINAEFANAKALEGAVTPDQRKYHASFITNYVFSSGNLSGFSVGGGERWESKAAIGYYGYASNPLTPNVINKNDLSRPVYDSGNYYTDLWIAYSRKIFSEKVRMKIQLNVDNVFESGGLQAIAVNWDGQPWAYRIIDPRQFKLTTTFTF